MIFEISKNKKKLKKNSMRNIFIIKVKKHGVRVWKRISKVRTTTKLLVEVSPSFNGHEIIKKLATVR